MVDARTESAIRRLTEHMRSRLAEKQREKTTHWTEVSNAWLCRRLRDKERQLRRAIESDLGFDEITKRCVDVANFAMMILDTTERAACSLAKNVDGKDCG